VRRDEGLVDVALNLPAGAAEVFDGDGVAFGIGDFEVFDEFGPVVLDLAGVLGRHVDGVSGRSKAALDMGDARLEVLDGDGVLRAGVGGGGLGGIGGRGSGKCRLEDDQGRQQAGAGPSAEADFSVQRSDKRPPHGGIVVGWRNILMKFGASGFQRVDPGRWGWWVRRGFL